MEKQIEALVEFLNTNSPDGGPYKFEKLKRYFRITGRGGNTACCFVAHQSFENKTMGTVSIGHIFYPASWSAPAKIPRGEIGDVSSFDSIFTRFGSPKTLR